MWVAADAGGGLAHGIEMVQEGPHKGRLALARHFDCDPNGDPPELQRDFVLYSDDKVRSANSPHTRELDLEPRGAQGLRV